MARFADPRFSRTKIDALVEVWKESCLINAGSLLFDDRQIWTVGNLEDFRRRFLDHPLLGTEESFGQKLSTQLETAAEDVRWLVCELLGVYFLFAREAIGGPAKRATLRAIIEPIGGDPAPDWTRLAEAMDGGIGNPGLGYNVRRDLQVGYLIDFALRFKALAGEHEQRALLADPWALRDFADQAGEGIEVREMRHILLHLLRPEEFERMSSQTHKRNIVDAFASELLTGTDVPDDLDERLFMIREKLVALNAQPKAPGGVLDFYYPPLRGIWDTSSERSEGASDLDLLLYKRQIVLYGPPGTGKTHRTRELADRLIRRVALERWKAVRFFSAQAELDEYVETNVHWVQLHPGYGYEEFVRGMRIGADGSVGYVNGLLPRLVKEMREVPEGDRLPVVLVLDEINRTDLSRLFGEAFSLLENRDTPLLLPGFDSEEGQELALPANLFVIGTMNLIDQSVEELDFALRRRFFWRPVGFEPTPVIEVNRQRWETRAPKRWAWDRAEPDMTLLAERAMLLNQEIASSPHLGAQYELGHTYYFDATFFALEDLKGRKHLSGGVLWTARGAPRQSLKDLWSFSIEPLLAQYLGGLEGDTASAELARLREVLMRGVVG
ncbi:MAG TPA: AAA family ATPase [Miltoncostaeaceae bacterium]|nr:AAA family ATPase [Miltoncostaeaceae bacterium]